jgi:transcriptional regulator GlxA family with amidase domain
MVIKLNFAAVKDQCGWAESMQASMIAAAAGISARTSHRLYERAYGNGIMNHLRTMRLLRAARLLLETDDTLAAICEQVGINGSSYFCKLFHRMFHATPMEYRANGIEAPILIPTRNKPTKPFRWEQTV